MLAENWKSAVGYDGIYEVSNVGRVRSIIKRGNSFDGKILKHSFNPKGYHLVGLYSNGKKSTITVHRLVAEAFIGLRPEGLQINHIDGDKNNNCLDNIEYATQSENMLHAFSMGLKSNRGESHPQCKLTEKDVHEIRQMLFNKSHKSIADLFNVCPGTITAIAAGRIWGWLKEGDNELIEFGDEEDA